MTTFAVDSARRGALAVVIASLVWSSGGLFIKVAPMPALALVFARSIVTGAFFLLALRPPMRQARLDTAVAYAGMVVTFVSATKMTTAANAVFLQYTAPIYVLVLAPWLLGERFRPRNGAIVLVSLAGMALVLMGRADAGQRVGNAVGAISGVFFAFTMVLLRRDAAAPGGVAVATASTALGNILAGVLALPFALGDLDAAFTLKGSLVVLYLGVVQMGLAYVLFTRGLRTVPAAAASIISMLEPVMNPVWVFLGTAERPSGHALVGGAVVLAAVAARSLLRS